MVFALETYCAATDGRSAARIEEEVVVTATGCEVITRFPAEELLVAGRMYVRGADLVADGDGRAQRRVASAVASSAVVGPARDDERDGNARARRRAPRLSPRPKRGRRPGRARCPAPRAGSRRAVSSAGRSARPTWRSRSSRSSRATSTSTCTRSSRASTCSRASRRCTSTAAPSARARRVRRDPRSASPHAFRSDGSRSLARDGRTAAAADGSDTFFLGPPPDAAAEPLDVRDPRNRNLFLPPTARWTSTG